jgi:hypothetical protein
MSRIELVETEIQRMSAEELATFRAWYAEFDAAAWDAQLEHDVAAGKLDRLAAQALADHELGLSTDL